MERVSLVRDSPASDTVSFGVRFQVCCGKAAIQSEIWYFEKHIFLLGHVRTCEDMFTFQFFTIIPCLNSSSEFWTEGRSSPGEKPGGVHRWRMHRGADALHLAEVHSAHPLHRVGDPLSRRAGRVEPGLGDALGKPKKMAKMLLLLTAWFGSESFESLAFHGFFVSRHAQGHPLGQLVHSQWRLSGVGESWSRKIYVGCLDHLCTHPSTHPSMLWGVLVALQASLETLRLGGSIPVGPSILAGQAETEQRFWPSEGLEMDSRRKFLVRWTVTVPARRNPSWWLKKHQDTISVLACQDNVTVGFKHLFEHLFEHLESLGTFSILFFRITKQAAWQSPSCWHVRLSWVTWVMSESHFHQLRTKDEESSNSCIGFTWRVVGSGISVPKWLLDSRQNEW